MRAWVSLAAGVALFVVLFPTPPAKGQGGDDKPDPVVERNVHFGAGSCAAQACHGGSTATRAEYKTWIEKDRHSRAFAVLGSDLGKRIGERLGLDPTKSDRCLNCHGTTGVETADTFDPTDGVSCEQCHGGAERWLGPHAAPGFKDRDPAEKERLGLRDLTTPAARAKLCVTCHVAGEGRDITHDIMAAGHPPLVFEAAHFLRSMPPHWVDEKDRRGEEWVEGLRASAVASLGHVARMADASNGVADFTVFDCYSCHHPIYAGSVYEKRKPAGKPGELPLEVSALRVLIEVAGVDGVSIEDAVADPQAPSKDLARKARLTAETLRDLTLTPKNVRAAMDAALARIEKGERIATRPELQIWAMGAQALANKRGAGFDEAVRAVDGALAPQAVLKPSETAKQIRAILAAGR